VFYSQMLETGGSLSLSEAQSSFTQSPRSDWLESRSPSGPPTLPIGQYLTMKVKGAESPPHMRRCPTPLDMRDPRTPARAADRAISPARWIVGATAAIALPEPYLQTPGIGMESGDGGGWRSDPSLTQST